MFPVLQMCDIKQVSPPESCMRSSSPTNSGDKKLKEKSLIDVGNVTYNKYNGTLQQAMIHDLFPKIKL